MPYKFASPGYVLVGVNVLVLLGSITWDAIFTARDLTTWEAPWTAEEVVGLSQRMESTPPPTRACHEMKRWGDKGTRVQKPFRLEALCFRQ